MCDTTGYENISDWGASSWERKLYRSSNLLFPATTISILQCVYSYLQHIQIPCLKKKTKSKSTKYCQEYFSFLEKYRQFLCD